MSRAILLLVLTTALTLHGQSMDCDLQSYRAAEGLRASRAAAGVEFTWDGEAGQKLRAVFTLRDGAPLIAELAARSVLGAWEVLGHNLRPEYEVTTGKRRLSEQQMAPLRKLGIALTPEVVGHEQWNAFWDAPLMVPGAPGTNLDLPRKASEIRHDHSRFHSNACTVRTDGARLEIEFNGLTLGIFSGSLRFTVYRGTNLLRQEAIATTEEPSVAYKYDAGLDGFALTPATKIVWRDTARAWQQYAFGGDANQNPVALKARNRLVVLEAGKASLAVFPPPHKFFFAREIETNLGFVYYRKDSPKAFAIGVRQAEREEPYRPYGVSDAE